MRLNLYLLREEVRASADVLRPRYRTNAEVTLLPPTRVLPFPAQAYLLHKGAQPPKWQGFLASHFDIDVGNVTNGFLLVLEASGRVFAASFGHAFHLLEPSTLEPDFGIRVCANLLDPRRVKALDARNVDVVTRQQRVHVSTAVSIEDFGVDVDENWVRYLSGSIDSDIAKSLAGTDALQINTKVTVDELAERCGELLEVFARDDYKTKFEFLDTFRPLRRGHHLVRELDAEVRHFLAERRDQRISVALPFFPEETTIDSYELFGGGAPRDTLEEMTLAALYAFLDEHGEITDPYHALRVIALDDQGEARSKAFPLKDYIVAEVERDQDTYVLTAGKWFRVNRNYAQGIRTQIAHLRDLTDDLALPPMRPAEAEGTYNQRVAHEKGWRHLDRQLFTGTGSERHQKIEVADILAPEHQFLCVKKMHSSAGLSHLFAQGAVSADLLRHEPRYRERAAQLGGNLVMDAIFNDPRPTFVFCIATERPGLVSESMFFFSAINLARQAKVIRRQHAEVALARIDQH